MKKSWLINLTIVCTILGLLLSWQYNSFRVVADSPLSIFQQGLIDRIEAREANIQLVEEEISDLRNQLSQFLEAEAQDSATLALLQESLNFQRALASMTSPDPGPGIIITLNDNNQGAAAARSADPTIFTPEDFIIHDFNIRYIVNELRAAGATAISINDQRLTASSEIRCMGTAILINSLRMHPPYEIKALALNNPEELKNRMESRGEIPSLRANNFPIEIEIAEVEIPEYRGSFRSSYLEMEEQ